MDAIVQGESYPTTVKDPSTGKQVAVTWTEAVTIDAKSNIEQNNDEQNVDDCRISKITLEGTIGNNVKVKATIGIIPRILGITTKSNTTNSLIPIVISISDDGVYDMSRASDELRAIIINPKTGEKVKKKVKVLLWDPPYINIGSSGNYNARAAINHYINSNNTNTVDVTLQVKYDSE